MLTDGGSGVRARPRGSATGRPHPSQSGRAETVVSLTGGFRPGLPAHRTPLEGVDLSRLSLWLTKPRLTLRGGACRRFLTWCCTARATSWAPRRPRRPRRTPRPRPRGPRRPFPRRRRSRWAPRAPAWRGDPAEGVDLPGRPPSAGGAGDLSAAGKSASCPSEGRSCCWRGPPVHQQTPTRRAAAASCCRRRPEGGAGQAGVRLGAARRAHRVGEPDVRALRRAPASSMRQTARLLRGAHRQQVPPVCSRTQCEDLFDRPERRRCVAPGHDAFHQHVQV